MMNCPHCSHTETQVVDSRPHAKRVLRKRRCLSCLGTFKTVEMPVEMASPLRAFEEKIEAARIAAREFSARLDKIGSEL